jgi:hypothetical protein
MKHHPNKQILIVITSIISLFWLGYICQIATLQTQLQNTKKQQIINKTQIQQQLLKLQIQQKQHNLFLLKTPAYIEQLTAATALKNIATAITTSQLTTISLIPITTATKQTSSQSFNLSAIGNYQQITNFFLAINNLNLLTNIVTFTIKQIDNDNNNNDNYCLMFNATIQIFTLHLNHKKTHGKINIKHDPFNNNTNTQPLPLTTWETKDLQFFGTIKNQQDNKSWGIIADPSNQIHYVTAGTFIGIDKNKINTITNNAIITENNLDNIYR